MWVSPEQETGLERLAACAAQHWYVWESQVCLGWMPHFLMTIPESESVAVPDSDFSSVLGLEYF